MLLDLMINHISRQSREFQDFQRHGRRSPSADLFITLDKVWPDGDPPDADVARIFLRKPEAPFSTVTIGRPGSRSGSGRRSGPPTGRSRSTSTSRSPATRSLIGGWCGPRRSGRPHRAARRRRVRDQEARHDLLHGRAGDLRVPRLDHGRRRLVRAGRPARGPRRVRDPRTAPAHGFWTYDFVLPGPAAARLRDGRGATAGGAPRAIPRPAVHDPGLPRRHPGPPGPRRHPGAGRDAGPGRARPSGAAETSTGSCRTRTRPASTCTS